MSNILHEAQHIITATFRAWREHDAWRYAAAIDECDIDVMEDVLIRAQDDPELLLMIEHILIGETSHMPVYDAENALSRIHRLIEREHNT